VAQQQQQQQQEQQQQQVSPRQRDKEWAALTTWLRMNLHHVSGRIALLHVSSSSAAVAVEQIYMIES
jgi:hypothetical protein